MGYNIYHNLLIRSSAEEVFHAISKPEHLNNWWTFESSGSPILGAEYNLNFTDPYNWFCKVSKVQDNASLHLKMTESDKDWLPTTFGFDLETTGQGTLLRFSHTNWEQDNDHFRHSSFCWAMLLNGLKNYIESGDIVPFEKRN